jgi:hypothetical protein
MFGISIRCVFSDRRYEEWIVERRYARRDVYGFVRRSGSLVRWSESV